MTSHDVVNRVRQISGVKKVGHAGTLDPLATGVLVIGIGREATKQLGMIMAGEKEYEALIILGAVSSTDDADGDIKDKQVKVIPTEIEVYKAAKKFRGEIDQKPPQYSAIKVGGQTAYRLARQGKKVNLGTRRVTIKTIEILDYQWPELKIRVACGSGTYIRSLARDIGETLDVGGYIKELTRIRVGKYTLDNSLTLKEFGMEEAH